VVKKADEGVNFEAQLFDLHPKITVEKDGRVKKYLELRLQTDEYDPRLLEKLIGMHGGQCSVSINKMQAELDFGAGGKGEKKTAAK